MKRYDPETSPDPVQWLALDEGERISLAERHHKAAKVQLPNVRVHAVIHTVVETQLAMNLEPVVRAMERLRREGLTRHDAVHAIGTAVAEHLFEAVRAPVEDSSDVLQARYNAAVERLTAKSWREEYGE